METRPYADKSAKPEEASLKKVLAGSYASYKDLIHLSSDFRQQWNHSKLSGWMQKISDSKKALFYVIPLQQSFRVSLTLRKNEKEILLKDQELKELEKLLKSAKKFSEGYALQLNVTGKEDYKIVSELINKIIALRK